MKSENRMRRVDVGRVLVVTGAVDSGKSSFAVRMAEELRAKGRSVRGIVSDAVRAHDGSKVAYRFRDLESGASVEYAVLRDPGSPGESAYPRFRFLDEGFAFAGEALLRTSEADTVIVDEIGPLELSGGGLRDALEALLRDFEGEIVLAARERILDSLLTLLDGFNRSVEVVRVGSERRDRKPMPRDAAAGRASGGPSD